MSSAQQHVARDVMMSDGDADERQERDDGDAEGEQEQDAADETMSSDDDDDDDDDDEVVASYPITLHQELTPHLYLIGSPFRPASRPYESDLGPLQSVRVKAAQRRVELEYGLQQDDDDVSGHYDRHSPHRLQRLLLTGRPVPCKTNYAIAAFSPHSGLHLTPLSATVRVKPDLQYLDVEAAEEALVQEAARREEEELERERERERQRDSEEWTAEDEAEDRRRRAAAQREEEEAKAVPDLRQLTVRFKRKESEKSAAYRQASHAFIKQQEDKEQWMQLQHRDAASQQAEAERRKLTVSSSSAASSSSLSSSVPAAETMDIMSYLSYLNPHSAAAHLSSASYAERILALLRSARLLPFTRILAKLGIPAASSSPTAVSLRSECLHSCDRFGYYIQHAFVIKSSLVFDSHITAASMDPALAQQVKAEQGHGGGGGGSRERERRGGGATGSVVTREEVCRDYLLCQFYQSPVVHRDRVSSVMRLDVEATEERLQELSERREGAAKGGWQWKWRQDDSEERCLNSLPAFAAMMRQQHKQIKEMETRARWALDTQQSAAAPAAQQPLALSASSSSPSSLIVNNNQPAPSLPSSSSSPAPSSAQNAALTLLTGLFRQYGVCSESFLLSQFAAAAASPATSASASASLPPSPLSNLSSDTFRSVIASTSLAITPSLFIRKSLHNPHVDRYRAVIASLFAVRSAVRKGDVHRAIEDCYGDEIPDNLYRKVMKEFATFEKGIWTLKTGNY